MARATRSRPSNGSEHTGGQDDPHHAQGPAARFHMTRSEAGPDSGASRRCVRRESAPLLANEGRSGCRNGRGGRPVLIEAGRTDWPFVAPIGSVKTGSRPFPLPAHQNNKPRFRLPVVRKFCCSKRRDARLAPHTPSLARRRVVGERQTLSSRESGKPAQDSRLRAPASQRCRSESTGLEITRPARHS